MKFLFFHCILCKFQFLLIFDNGFKVVVVFFLKVLFLLINKSLLKIFLYWYSSRMKCTVKPLHKDRKENLTGPAHLKFKKNPGCKARFTNRTRSLYTKLTCYNMLLLFCIVGFSSVSERRHETTDVKEVYFITRKVFHLIISLIMYKYS